MSEIDHIDNAEFLQAVFGNMEEGETPAVCAFPGPVEDRQFWTVHTPENPTVKQYLSKTASNNYFCVSSVADGPQLRRRHADIKRTFVIPLDDIGTGLGAKVTPAEVPVSPTYIIETSPNNFQYGYVLDVPESDIVTTKVLMKLMAGITGSDDGGSMAAKLIRLPRGYNAKKKYGVLPPPTKLTLWNPERKFSVDELISAFEIDIDVFNRMYEEDATAITTRQLGPGYQDDTLKWLLSRDMLHGDAPDPSGFFTISCPWHETHTDGSVGAGYSPLGYGGQYSNTRQFNCLHSHCQERTARDLISVMFQDRFSFCTADKRVRDRLYPKNSFAASDFHIYMKPFHYQEEQANGSFKTRYYSQQWIEGLDRVDVERETFVPDPTRTGPFMDLVSGSKMFNSFERYDHLHPRTNATDKIEPVIEHIKYLFGSEWENALGYLAYTFHKPTVRLGFALLHVSPHHGTGRGWFKQLMSKLYGLPYHKPASFQNYVNTSYNEFLNRSLLVSFDEVYDRKERFTVGEQLRELITETEVEVNVKYGFKGELPIFANFLFFSNHIDALMIPDDDRRFWCVVCDHEPKSTQYYNELYALLEQPETLAQFFWYLKRYMATSAFNPKGRAPHTEWTDELKSANQEENFEVPIKERVQELRLLGVKAIWRSQLLSDCRAKGAEIPLEMNRGPASRQLEAVLRESRLRRHKHRVRRESGKLEFVYFPGEPTRDSVEVRQWAEAAEAFALPTSNIRVLRP